MGINWSCQLCFNILIFLKLYCRPVKYCTLTSAEFEPLSRRLTFIFSFNFSFYQFPFSFFYDKATVTVLIRLNAAAFINV